MIRPAARFALWGGKRLPYDAEVEFLQSSGTQYINADIVATRGHVLRTEVGISFANTSTRQLNGSNDYYFWGVKNGTFECFSAAGGTASANTWYNLVATFDTATENRASLSVDGGTPITASYGTVQTYNYTTLLFALGSRTGIVDGFYNSAKVSYCRYYLDGTLVRDYIPVRVGTVGYLYDRVTGKLFGNAGTGDFVLGPDVVPVEYIESHGTEYINLDYLQADVLRVKFGASISSNYSTGEMDIAGNQAAVSGAGRFVLGVYDTKFFAYSRYSENDGNAISDTISKDVMYSVDCTYNTTGNTKTLTVNGQDYTVDKCRSISNDINRVRLFAAANGVSQLWRGRLAYMSMWKDGAKWYDFKAIRVGSGSTWEGAMMDVLTRRIYRNDGTGAFSYGNDLKYPIPSE